jgi:DNA-binding beta-propeller fold protein YncE
MNNVRTTTVSVALAIVAGTVLPSTVSASAPEGDNKDLVLVTTDNVGGDAGSVVLLKRDPTNKTSPYFEAERVEPGLIQAHWPANQYTGSTHWWWVGQTNGTLKGFEFRREAPLQEMVDDPDRQVTVDTYKKELPNPQVGSNFAGVTPNAKSVWNSAREVDEIQEIDADPNSPTFGQILTRIDVPLSPKASTPTSALGAMRPCDMSITPDGKFLFEPDLGGETVTALEIRSKKVVDQLLLTPYDPTVSARVRPFMLTTNGRIALVENLEGTYAVLDVTDPYNLREIKRLTRDDGVGVSPQTSEFTPDGKYAFLIANGSSVTATAPAVPGVVSVLDLRTLTITKQIELPPNCRPHAGDFSRDGQHFFVNCSGASSVAVIDTKWQQVVQNVLLAGNLTPRGVVVR